jgi:hypothetical protein
MLFAVLAGASAVVKTPFGWLNYAVIVLYLLGILLLGTWFTRRQKTTNDYFKGGGRVPWWAAGLSIYATMLSSITFIAILAKSFGTNWTSFWVNVPILLLAPIIIRCFLPFYRQLNVTSVYTSKSGSIAFCGFTVVRHLSYFKLAGNPLFFIFQLLC